MKILTQAKTTPAPPSAWWVGKIANCANCKSCIQLEEGDTVQPVDIKREGKTETVVLFDCPKCGKPQRIVKA